MTATPPLETRQQSSSWNGSATQREDWWSSIVIGVRIWASGLAIAHSRWATAMCANCSLVVPYFEHVPAGREGVHRVGALDARGRHHAAPARRSAAPAVGRPVRRPWVSGASPKTQATTSAIPDSTAMQAVVHHRAGRRAVGLHLRAAATDRAGRASAAGRSIRRGSPRPRPAGRRCPDGPARRRRRPAAPRRRRTRPPFGRRPCPRLGDPQPGDHRIPRSGRH